MKRIIALLIVVVIATITVHAQDYLVIKKDKAVTVISFKEVNEYGIKNWDIGMANFTDPTVATLNSIGVPQIAWPMCADYRNGIYDTRLEKMRSDYNDLKNDNESLRERIDSLETSKAISWAIYIFGGLALLVAFGMLHDRNQKIKMLTAGTHTC